MSNPKPGVQVGLTVGRSSAQEPSHVKGEAPAGGEATAMSVGAPMGAVVEDAGVELGATVKVLFSDHEKAEAKASLAGAECVTTMVPDFVESGTVGMWRKADGSIWVEQDYAERHRSTYSLALRIPAGSDLMLGFDLDKKLRRGGYVDLQTLPNGNVLACATREFYSEAESILRRAEQSGTDAALMDVFEDFCCNGWKVVDCASMGGGAFAITNNGGDTLHDGALGYYDVYWEHAAYVTENPIKALFEKGALELRRGTPAEWLSPEQIREWKDKTNRDYREHSGGDFDLFPLDEQPAAQPEVPLMEAIRVAAIARIQVGHMITDGMVTGTVTGEGALGSQKLPAWVVQIEGGARAGEESLILKSAVKSVWMDEALEREVLESVSPKNR